MNGGALDGCSIAPPSSEQVLAVATPRADEETGVHLQLPSGS
jgi:hypothetical protein